MEKYSVYDVFTPTKPARLAFVERDSINEKLVNALRTPGKQVVVYGHSGSGKTTLLVNKLHQLYEHHITTRCIAGLTYDQIILDAFDQLDPFYMSEFNDTKSYSVESKIAQDYALIKSQISAHISESDQVKSVRFLPPQLTPQSLARFIGKIKGCWVIEDFHKVQESERNKLSQTMKVFMDMADEYGEVKVIAIGAVDTARLVVEYDSEMRNRVAEIHVPLMEPKEIEQIIQKGASLLNVVIGPDLVKRIIGYANGLASICHHLCLNLCIANELEETGDDLLLIQLSTISKALDVYLDEASDTLKKIFDNALKQKKTKKYNNAKLILKALLELPQEGGLRSEIYQKIIENCSSYPQGNLTIFLRELSRENDGSLIRYDSASGRYSFKDPVCRAYALVLFSKEEKFSDASDAFKSVNIIGNNASSDIFTRTLVEKLFMLVNDKIK